MVWYILFLCLNTWLPCIGLVVLRLVAYCGLLLHGIDCAGFKYLVGANVLFLLFIAL